MTGSGTRVRRLQLVERGEPQRSFKNAARAAQRPADWHLRTAAGCLSCSGANRLVIILREAGKRRACVSACVGGRDHSSRSDATAELGRVHGRQPHVLRWPKRPSPRQSRALQCPLDPHPGGSPQTRGRPSTWRGAQQRSKQGVGERHHMSFYRLASPSHADSDTTASQKLGRTGVGKPTACTPHDATGVARSRHERHGRPRRPLARRSPPRSALTWACGSWQSPRP